MNRTLSANGFSDPGPHSTGLVGGLQGILVHWHISGSQDGKHPIYLACLIDIDEPDRGVGFF